MSGLFITLLSMLSGACLTLAILNGIFALREKPVKREALMLSLCSLVVCIYSYANTRLYISETPENFLAINRVDMFCTAIFMIAILLFIRYYTGIFHRLISIPLIVIMIITPFARLFSPTTLTYANVRGMRNVELIWGEKLRIIDADVSIFGIIYFFIALFILFYVFYLSVRFYISKRNRISLFLLIGSLVLTLGALNDAIVDSFSLKWVYLSEFGYTGFLLFMTLSLYNDILEVTAIRNTLTDSQLKQREIEEKLVIKEQDYGEIFNSSNDAIIVFDAENGLVIDVNESMLQMFGCAKDKILGKSMNQFETGDIPLKDKQFNDFLRQAIEEGHVLFEWPSRKTDGSVFWTEYNLKYSHVGSEGKIIAVVRDITERKATQSLLIQSEKMMSLGGLAAGMAHEINNPLAGIVQTANVLSNRLIEKVDSPVNRKAAEEAGTNVESIISYMEKRDIKKMMASIINSGKRISEIVNNMLSFSRKSQSQPLECKVDDLIDRTLAIIATDYDLKKNYDFKSIKLEKYYNEDVPLIQCVVSEIQQVLINILRNGAQAMHSDDNENPTFIIRTMFDSFKNMTTIEIEDNGPGMDESVRKRIFEPFYTTKPEGLGTGLGLSVSYFIITSHHKGEMSVESVPGEGTKFSISLPAMKDSIDNFLP